MFARIASRYDRLNAIMSAGRHHAWRRIAVEIAVGDLSGPALDVATGTGDLAIELARQPQVSHAVGLDFTREMLPLAVRKTRERDLGHRTGYLAGDAHALPFQDDRFICATVGFGVRNFIDLSKALREMARVVRPGGRVVVLEIVRLEGLGPMGRLFPLYFRHVTPWLGAIFGGDREAYTYLPESVQGFLTAGEVAAIMRDAGMANVTYRKLALGTVAVHVGEKEA